MDDEDYERAKPMLWAMFVSALAQKQSVSMAANKADDLLEEFEKRYGPVEPKAEDDD